MDSKNWSDLPVEIKEPVVKYLDFKSSLCLRLTARLERRLVDSKKFDFSRIELRTIGRGSLVIWNLRKNGIREMVYRCENDNDNLAQLMAHILKVGNIGELDIDTSASVMDEFLRRTDEIRVRNLRIFNSFPVDSTVRFLSKCPEILDSVNIRHRRSYSPFRVDPHFQEAELAKISNTKILYYRYIKGRLCQKRFSQIVMAFANRQHQISGTTVNLSIATGSAILNFPPNFPRSRIQSGDRIPTVDPSVEILFEVSGADLKMHFVPTETIILRF